MDKAQALHSFWSSFGIPAYDENTVDPEAAMPYITYEVSTGAIGAQIPLSASIYYRSYSWAAIEQKAAEIAARLGYSELTIPIDGGYVRLWNDHTNTFATRMSEPSDDGVRRMRLSLQAEVLTEY